MGGVAKAVGGAVGGVNKGIKGENAGPSESTIKNAQLWPDLRDPVYRAIQDATKLYQQGYSVPEMNRRQWQGIEGIEDWATNYGGRLEDVVGNIGNIARGNRTGDAPGQDFLQSIYAAGGTPKEGWDTLRQAADLADDGSGGLQFLRETAGGGFLGQNPYVDNVIKAMNRGTKDAYGNTIAGLEGSMSRAGGMGGSMEALLRGRENEGLARSLAENEAAVRYADYGKERGYQEAARQALPGALATETGAMTAAGGALNDAAYQRLAAQMTAANQAGQGYRSDIQQQMQAAGTLPGLGQSGFNVGSNLLNAGEYTRANLEKQNNAGWTGLQQYLNTLGGVRNLFGSGGGSIQQPPSANSQAWGNAMQMAQLFGPMLMGSTGGGYTGPPSGMAGNAGIPSDRRLKTDVELMTAGPVPLYRWRYVWGGPRYEGPMAQDVARVAPELVTVGPGGFLLIPAALVREVP